MIKPTLTELSFNPLMRSEEVVRYSGVYQAQPESLAVHICDTSMMAYLIAMQLKSMGETIDVGVLLEKCLLHDLDETMTGDIPRNTKYANENIKHECDNLQDAALKTISKYIGDEEFIDTCKNAKQGKEGIILKIADMLNVARRALMEIELRGNRSFLKVVEELSEHINYLSTLDYKEFNEDSVNWIKDLLIDSRDCIRELHYSNRRYIDKYSIMENVLAATPYQNDKESNGKKPPRKD